MKYIIGIISSLIVLGALFYFLGGGSRAKGNAIEVDWRFLGEMDYVTGTYGGELKAVNGQYVRVPGFMVPLEDDQKKVTEFLLVPTPQACIHVPAPPPNQMVHVTMNKNHETAVAFGPIWIYGKLKIETKASQYGNSSYQIEGDFIEPYQ